MKISSGGWEGEKVARSGRSISPHHLKRSRASLKECEGAGTRPSCSQSPHDETVVARCAQERTGCLFPLEKVKRRKGLARWPQSKAWSVNKSILKPDPKSMFQA